VKQQQRGQAFLETVAFLPLFILVLAAIIYFSQYGVMQERAYAAVRYAQLVSNNQGYTSAYSLESMYHELEREGNNSQNPASPQYTCTTSTQGDAQNALVQAQPVPVPDAGSTAAPSASAPPYFRPTKAAVAQCDSSAITFDGASPLATNFYTIELVDLAAEQLIPKPLQPILGGTTGNIHAAMGMVRPAPANYLLYCAPQFTSTLADSLGALEPKPLAGPYAGYKPPGTPRSC
jgi:hypothetical protein